MKLERAMTADERIDHGQRLMRRLAAEDKFNRRELNDPSFTVDELARLACKSKRELLALVMESNIGRTTRRNGRVVRVLTLREIKRLAEEFSWL